jgi:Ca2+-transporting ATPase
LLLGWRYPTLFSPIHIIFLELIMGPTCSIFYEREPVEKGIMKRPPRPGGEKLFRGGELAVALALGLATATGLLGIYYYFMGHGYSLQYTRTVVFVTLVMSNIFLTFIGRSLREPFFVTIRYRNNLVPLILVLSVSFFAFLYFVPFARRIFELSTVSGGHVLIALGTALVSTGWFEIYKVLHGPSINKSK